MNYSEWLNKCGTSLIMDGELFEHLEKLRGKDTDWERADAIDVYTETQMGKYRRVYKPVAYGEKDGKVLVGYLMTIEETIWSRYGIN